MPTRPEEKDQEKKTAPQMSTPDRAARKALLRELEEAQLKKQDKDIPGLPEYAEKLRRLDEQLDERSALDPWGLPKSLTAEQKAELEAAMRETAEAGETFLENGKKAGEKNPSIQMNKGVPGLVGKLQGMLVRDMAALQGYDPREPMSLPELMEKSRCRTIELGATEIKAMGGAQSSRLPMTLVNEKGESRRGFLTKASTVDLKKRYLEGIEAAKAGASEETKKELDDLLNVYRKRSKLGFEKSDEHAIASLFGSFDQKKKPLTEQNLPVMLRNLGVKQPLSEAARKAMLKSWTPLISVSTSVNTFELGLKEGDRVDVRNSAMSAVADLLGKPDLLARSTDVRFTDGKGKIAEGTFMDYAKGLDLDTDKRRIDQFKQVADEPFTAKNKAEAAKTGAFLRSVSDLQVVDFLCGNVDRHSANLTYIADDDGMLVGVQGIDNDSSFGNLAPGEKAQLRMPGTGNMGVISESMAEKIEGLTPSMLRFALRGRHLTEEQLDAAALRLKQLKGAIKKGEEHYKDKPIPPADKGLAYEEGFLRKVKDEDFEKLHISQLCSPEPKNKQNWFKNLFGEIGHWIPKLLSRARKKGVNFVPEAEREKEKDDLTRVSTLGKTLNEQLKVKNISDTLTGITGFVKLNNARLYGDKTDVDQLTQGKNGSKEFSEMVKSAKELAALQNYFHKLSKAGVTLTGQEYRQYHEKVRSALEKLDEKHDKYARRKIKEKKVQKEADLRGKNDYEQRRINYSKSLGSYLDRAKKQFEKLPVPEKLLKDGDEVRAQAEMRDLEERRAAMSALRKLHEEKGLASPEEMRSALRSDDPKEREKAAGELTAANKKPPVLGGP